MFRHDHRCWRAIVVYIAVLSACDRQGSGAAWTQRPDSVGFRTITGFATACTECIVVKDLVTLGADTAEGFLEDKGAIDYVVRDHLRRYWVGQRGFIKVFASDGAFLRTVGRPGQGPLEFQMAQPVRVDDAGMVHVFDTRSGRETIIRPDFTRETDRPIPLGIDAIAPLPGEGHRYVIVRWFPTADRVGFPLHVISGSEILTSFGLISQSGRTQVKRDQSGRAVSVDSAGYVISSKLDTYVIEAWSASGARVAGFELPDLNPPHARPGVWSLENPPINTVVQISPYDSRRLWVVSWHRRPNWRDAVVERVSPNGARFLTTKNGQISSVLRSRIDLLDLDASAIMATSWHEGLLLRFVEPGVLLRLDYNENGAPLLKILEVTFNP